ncbi:MAG: aminotransferase class III-fold pyridoxal phosphate-dependent enzyme, partial [Deltaproteobacteria bacterium]|nr:aminotransferase class III-fold pyridoxal phosphate-dependent enzyme [Deltaproteobacteria bacterium]
VMVEPIQGESGIRIPADDYLPKLRKLCDDKGILLIFDEIQSGMGRTGTLFAYEHSGVQPDIMTLAKALGNGYPLGAMLASDKVASAFVPGNHASTFGGNPLGMAAGIAVIDTMLDGGILDNCKEIGLYFLEKLHELKGRYDVIVDVRGKGLMLGVELSIPGDDIIKKIMEKGVFINCTNGNVLRFVPPLIVDRADVDHVITILDEVLESS